MGVVKMTDNNIKSIVSEYIESSTNITGLAYDMDIFEEGLVNSLFAIELMTYLEKEFSIKITMDDLDMSHFKSVDSIAAFVVNKK